MSDVNALAPADINPLYAFLRAKGRAFRTADAAAEMEGSAVLSKIIDDGVEAIVPLIYQGALVGYLPMPARPGRAVTDEELALLDELSVMAAAATVLAILEEGGQIPEWREESA